MKRNPVEWFKELEKRLPRRLTQEEIINARDKIAQWSDETTRRMVCKPEFTITIGRGECIIEIDGQKNVCTGKTLATLIALCETTMIGIDGAVVQESTETNEEKLVIPPKWQRLAEEVHSFTTQWWKKMRPTIAQLDREAHELWAPMPMAAR